MRYTPLDEFDDTAFLTVFSNDPLHPEVVVTADGMSTFYGEQLDVFEQSLKASVDILFTLDRSGSMSDDNALVVANFDTFINTLVELDLDYHVAVAVEDDGCILGSDAYIDNTFSLSDAESTFETQADIYLTLGTYGANTERGFSLAEAALATGQRRVGRLQRGPLPRGGCAGDRARLRRARAERQSLHLLRESVPGDEARPGRRRHPRGGRRLPGRVRVGGRRHGLLRGHRGHRRPVPVDLCHRLGESPRGARRGQRGGANDSFELTQLPVPETIEVQVDGIRTTTGWQYDASINSIVFDRDHIPAGGSTIEVEYALMPDCEA